MRIGLISNIEKDKNLAVSKKVYDAVVQNGLDILLHPSLAALSESAQFADLQNSFASQCDMIAVVGGDGTILSTVVDAAKSYVPILGVNIGRVGFLAEVEVSDIEKAISAVKRQEFSVEQRTLLKVACRGNTYFALNEIVLTRAQECKIIPYEVYVGDTFVDAYNADGFLASTPTGSTAYSLSAGGPILSPTIKGIVLTAICSHSLHTRSIVIGDEERIRVCVNKKPNEICVVVDGKTVGVIKDFDAIDIEKATLCAQFVRFGKNEFYARLLQKLNKWSGSDHGNKR